MNYELVAVTILWTFLFGYLIVASIDYGAGFLSYYTKKLQSEHTIHKIIQRYLSPVWEITNVFLVFFVVGLVSFFPEAAYYYGTSLLIPGSLAIILLAVRGSYYAFATYGKKESRLYTLLYGVTGLLLPATLSLVLIISEGGFITIQNDGVTLQMFSVFQEPFTWSVLLLAIFSVLYISSTFLTYYASKSGEDESVLFLRNIAFFTAIPTMLFGLATLLLLTRHNPMHLENLANVWWMYGISFALFVGTIYLMMSKKAYGLAFVFLVFQYATAFFGYGASKLPFLLYPHLTIYDGFTNEAMAIALLLTFLGGLILLVPSLYLVVKWFVFDKKYVQAPNH